MRPSKSLRYFPSLLPLPITPASPLPASYMFRPKPRTPAQRHVRRAIHPHLFTGEPVRSLVVPLKNNGGRNNTGHLCSKNVGGGDKRDLRRIDFHRHLPGEQSVVRIESDPGRSAHIALIKDENGTLSYVLAPEGLRAGDTVQSYRNFNQTLAAKIIKDSGFTVDQEDDFQSEGSQASSAGAEALHSSASASSDSKGIRPKTASSDASSQMSISTTKPAAPGGNAITPNFSGIELGIIQRAICKLGNLVPLYLVPAGLTVHGITLRPGGRQQFARSAGVGAQVLSVGPKYAAVRMKSGEVRNVLKDGFCSVGTVSNLEKKQEILGNAGASRRLGRRPRVRGVAMNRCDHPLGGGRGKSKSNRQGQSETGVLAHGGRTRRPKDKHGNKMVIRERPRGAHTKNTK